MDKSKKLDTVLTVLAAVVCIVGFVLCIRMLVADESEHYTEGFQSLVTGTLQFTNVLLIIGAVAAVGFGLWYFITDIKNRIPTLIGIVVFVVLGLIGYSLASDTVLSTYPEGITAETSKWSEGGLIFMYILVVIAIGAALIGEVSRIFK